MVNDLLHIQPITEDSNSNTASADDTQQIFARYQTPNSSFHQVNDHIDEVLSNENQVENRLLDKANSDDISANLKEAITYLEEQNVNSRKATKIETFNFIRKGAILKRIPKAAIIETAKLLTSLLNEIVKDHNNTKNWLKLFNFARCCLNKPKLERKKGKSLSTLVKKQICDFSENLHTINELKKSKRTKDPKQELKKLVSSKLGAGDIKGAVRILSSSDKVIPFSKTTLSELQTKHPAPNPNSSLPNPPDNSEISDYLHITAQEVKKAIKSFKLGSSGGPDGLQPQHLKDLTSENLGEIGKQVSESIAQFANQVVYPGNVPEIVRSSFYGANLLALSKKDGGIRPIAVGNCLRRLVAKTAMARLSNDAAKMFRPHQLGVGIPTGAEAAAHATRRYINASHQANKVLLKIDFENAFNSIRRDIMLKKVKQHAPSIYCFIWQAYAGNSKLFFHDAIIESREGCQQGDPCASYLFSLCIQDLILSLGSELNLWYLDDGCIAGDPDTVLKDFSKIIDAHATTGLKVKPSKCEIFFLNNLDKEVLNKFKNLAPDIKLTTKS